MVTAYIPLQRRRRMAARIALYSSLVLVAGLAVLAVHYLDRPLHKRAAEQWSDVDYLALPEVKLLREYVRIDTSEKTGDEVAGARFLARQLASAGIPARLEVLGNRHVNLYALLPGEDPRPLVLHNHIDVESVDPKEWFYPPFEAHVELPWLYGRGVFDMKSVAIAQLLTLIDLKKSGKPLRRSVLFLATSSEERGSRLGVRWILRQHPELVRSFWAVLTEGGAVEARARDDIKYWATELAQKRFADVIVCGADRQQLEDLRQALLERGYAETGLRIVPEVRTYLEAYAPTRDRSELRDLLEHPDDTIHDIAAFRKLPGYIKSLFRNEAVPFPVAKAPGGGYQLLIKLHLLPGQEIAPVLGELVPRWMTHGLSVTLDEPPSARHGSPLDHPVYRQVLAAIQDRYPDARPGPGFLPWTATDSRFFRVAGVPSYGFSPFLIMNTDTLQVDRANERFALPAFVDGVNLYRDLVRRLVL